MTSTPDLKTSLRASLDQAPWSWIEPHARRDAVICVLPTLDLVEVGVAVAQDNAQAVQAWISEQKIAKPSREQLDTWTVESDKRFTVLVVAPYVLVQELLN